MSETPENLSLMTEGALSALLESALFKNVCSYVYKLTLDRKTWISWNCQVTLLSFLLCISLNVLPVPSSRFTASNQSLASFLRCLLCMSPHPAILTYLFPLF